MARFIKLFLVLVLFLAGNYAILQGAVIEDVLIIGSGGIHDFGQVNPNMMYDRFFLIELSPTIPNDEDIGVIDYEIQPKKKCKTFGENGACYEYYPSLCPYLSEIPEFNEDLGFSSPNETEPYPSAFGTIYKTFDEVDDEWTTRLKTPCFSGECPQDYSSALSGTPLDPALKGATFGCDLEIRVTNISGGIFPVWDLPLSKSIAYAFEAHIIPVTAVLGESTPDLTPVVIIPGLSGTELFSNNDFIWIDLVQMLFDNNDQFLQDLILDSSGNSVGNITKGSVIEKVGNVDIFESLISSLENDGYLEGSSLFFFPYDWRLNLDTTIDLLNDRIEGAKRNSGSDKVDIVVHSMGGLVIKNYINTYGKSSINKLIFVGTPHLGAPKAAKVILEGDRISVPWLEEDRVQEIAENSPAIYSLLPNQTYFNNLLGYIRPFSFSIFEDPLYNYSETKEFLIQEGANNNVFIQAESFFGKNLQNTDFSGIDTYNIAGCQTETQSEYDLNIFNNIGWVGYSTGDETVPLGSADYINIPDSKKYYMRDIKHSELPSTEDVRSAVLNILSGENITITDDFRDDPAFCGIKGKITAWHSPVEVHIYSEGKHTGPIEGNAIEYGIPGVGYDTIGEKKFIFLPTDEGQQYNIEAKGTDTGTFDLLISENENGNIIETKVFNDVPVSPATNIDFPISDLTTDETIEVDQGTGSAPVNAVATLSGSESNDVASPVTTANTIGTAGLNSWYKNDVSGELNATDDNSGVLETRYSLNGQTFLLYSAPVPITQEGTTTVRYLSIDKAGNNEETKTLEIKIDKTAPEINSNFDKQLKTFVFNSGDAGILCTQNQCTATDPAGNTAKLQFERLKLLNIYTLIFKSISYNSGAVQKFPDNAFPVIFENKNTAIKLFTQTFLLKKQQIMKINYSPTKNQSVIYSLKKDGGFAKQVLEGIKNLVVNSNMGKLETMIK